jgi:group I intron endonuclease
MNTEKNNIGFVYKWINIKNNKWYIGSHFGDINDGYTASGNAIKKAFKKYGLKFFIREIIYVGSDYKEQEHLILTQTNAANDPLSYNLKNTSIGGDVWVGRKDTDEYKEYLKKISQPGEKNGMYGKTHTEEVKEKLRKKATGKKAWNKGLKNYLSKEHALAFSRKDFKHSEKTKEKMSERRKGSQNANAKKVIINGITYESLKEASIATGLSYYKINKLRYCTNRS